MTVSSIEKYLIGVMRKNYTEGLRDHFKLDEDLAVGAECREMQSDGNNEQKDNNQI